MALASRHASRRSTGRRWIVIGLAVTILVLLADASIRSRSPGPVHQLAGQAWLDRALADVSTSNTAGASLQAMLAGHFTVSPAGSTAAATAPATTTTTAPGTTSTSTAVPTATLTAAVVNQLDTMANQATGAYRSYSRLRAPATLAGPAGLLETCLLVRSQAAAAIRSAVSAELAAPASTSAAATAAAAVVSQVQRLEVADSAYGLFAAQLPRSLGKVVVPRSQWIPSSGTYTTTALAVTLASLRAQVDVTPSYDLVIEAVSTTPAALGTSGKTEVLSPSSQVSVDVVIGNTGNQDLGPATVTVTLSSALGYPTARNFSSSLTPGQSQTVSVGSLEPTQGVPVTLTVTVTPPAGSPAASATRTLSVEEPSPNASAPTTSTTTTAPAG